ncbi:MAG TPA: sensor histidine kinase [Ilumatobacteraceae bacterium]|nr:sensor histidine kinase [Ilumatobacteraceae bacterium]
MNWFGRLAERLRRVNAQIVDIVLALVFSVIGVITVFAQDIEANGVLIDGYKEPSALVLVTVLVTSLPIAVRRRAPFIALAVSAVGILIHILADWPEGSLPLSVLLLTYTVGAWCPFRKAVAGMAMVAGIITLMWAVDSPKFDALDVAGIIAQFTAVWAIGVALRSRRLATESRIREAEERAEVERQSAARSLAEERLRIAQELHDVVAHSMSVIAVQAGVGAHVLDERPEQARQALDAISATSRGALQELRRLLGVLRDRDGNRSHLPAPGLGDIPRLVDDVKAAGVPVTLHVEGGTDSLHPGVELSAYRVVQEALTNVIKHAGSPSRVDVSVEHHPGSLSIEVLDDGRGIASRPLNGTPDGLDGGGQGLLGMRERVELWGGELAVGPVAGGGYRVRARLPYGEPE